MVAQAYIPLLNPAATWQDNNSGGNPGPNTSFYECYVYWIGGDSVVDGTDYKTLFRRGRYAFSQSVPPYNSGNYWYANELVALLREDTVARKVFIRQANSLIEFLFYDFSVGLGPYPSTYVIEGGYNVILVDTVILSDGPHRRITLDSWQEIVEGIGYLGGFMPLHQDVYWLHHLVCHAVGGVVDYEISIFDCACGSNVGIEATTEQDLELVPNPATTSCRLEGASPNALFQLRSLEGRTLITGACSSNGQTTIDLSSLPAGMYLLDVLGASRATRVKVIKQ